KAVAVFIPRSSCAKTRLLLESAYVVNPLSPAFQRLLSDGVFGCINGKQNVGMSRYSLFQYGQHTLQLLLLRHGIRTRTGGFSPNIDKVCSLIHHLINMLKRQFNSIEAPSIRKGVGRHV